MIKGLCSSARAYRYHIRDGEFHSQCTSLGTQLIEALNTAMYRAQRCQVLVSLANGTFTSLNTSIDIEKFLRQRLIDGDKVEVRGLSS